MAEKSFLVKKGWLIAQDEYGNMLPFFLHVRDKDIKWQSDHSEIIENIIKMNNITNIAEVNPSQRISFMSENWRVEADCRNSLCTLYTSIKFTKNTFGMNANRDDLFGNITLPVSFVNNEEFNILCTLNTGLEQLAFSNIIANKVVSNNTGMIDNVVIHVRNPIYKFNSSFYNLPAYKESSIYVTVNGRFKERES